MDPTEAVIEKGNPSMDMVQRYNYSVIPLTPYPVSCPNPIVRLPHYPSTPFIPLSPVLQYPATPLPPYPPYPFTPILRCGS